MANEIQEAVFRIGTSMYAVFTLVDWTTTYLEIQGGGYMYDDSSEFELIRTTQPGLFETWDSCSNKIHGSLNIPDGVYNVASNFCYAREAFAVYDVLVLGKDVVSIGENAFRNGNTTGLEKIFVRGYNIEYIGKHAFAGHNMLYNAQFNGCGTYIDDFAFQNCRSIEHLNLSTEIEYIGEYAFDGCNSLIDINIGNKVGNMNPQGTFRDCNSIEYFEFTDEAVFSESDFNRAFYVEIGAGSNCNEDGLQITKIKTQNQYAYAHDWVGLENRYPVFEGGVPFIILNHLGKHVVINGYNQVEGHIPVKHGDMTLWLKISPTRTAKSSPLVFKDNDKIWYIDN